MATILLNFYAGAHLYWDDKVLSISNRLFFAWCYWKQRWTVWNSGGRMFIVILQRNCDRLEKETLLGHWSEGIFSPSCCIFNCNPLLLEVCRYLDLDPVLLSCLPLSYPQPSTTSILFLHSHSLFPPLSFLVLSLFLSILSNLFLLSFILS